jgi:mediator of RNA polymerase II transcription subunit 20
MFVVVLLQVEYRPSFIASNCWDLLREFMQSFLGSVVQNAPPTYLQVRTILRSTLPPRNNLIARCTINYAHEAINKLKQPLIRAAARNSWLWDARRDDMLWCVFQNRMNDMYQPLDTIQQYLDHFSSYRKVAGL